MESYVEKLNKKLDSIVVLVMASLLLGLSISIKEKKKQLYIYDISLISIGALLFITTMLIIIF